MDTWVYENTIKRYVTPLKKFIIGSQIKYLVQIDNKTYVYTETLSRDNSYITYTLSKDEYVPSQYQVMLQKDDCPNIEVVVSLYECSDKCKSDYINVIQSTRKDISNNYEKIVENPYNYQITEPLFPVNSVQNKGLYDFNTVDPATSFIGNIGEDDSEIYFDFGSGEEDVWADKPSWEK